MRFTVSAGNAERRNQYPEIEIIIGMPSTLSFSSILFLGCLAGFTIYLGLPLALVASKTTRNFANALSVGVLLFILIDILGKAFETVKSTILDSLARKGNWEPAFFYALLLVLGLAGAYLGLVAFERKWMNRQGEASNFQAKTLALIIATGIGLHNFSEGLAIGQELANGAMALGFLLVIGFALHNATEGFGISAPLTGEKPSLSLLFLLGLIGGGPTVLGTVIGQSFKHPMLETFFLALASGAIFYVVGELSHIGRLKGSHTVVAAGILTGLFLAYGSDIVIDGAHLFAK